MRISVIIPLYNAEKFIAKTLESILQLAEVKEILVIDDGYKDKARSIVENYAQKHNHIKIFQHPNRENKGAGASRNLGIKKATQEYIAFLDADDFYLSNRFKKDSEIFKKYPDADGCHNALGKHFYSERARERFQKHFKNKEITTVSREAKPTPANLLTGLAGKIKDYGYFSLDCLTIKRKSLLENKLFFNEALLVHQDTDFIFKLAHYCKIYPSEITKPTAKRGIHEENRITQNFENTRPKRYHNRFLQYESLYYWAREENIHPEILKIFEEKYLFYKLAKENNVKLRDLRREIFKNPTLLKNKNIAALLDIYTTNSKRISRIVFYQFPRYVYKILK